MPAQLNPVPNKIQTIQSRTDREDHHHTSREIAFIYPSREALYLYVPILLAQTNPVFPAESLSESQNRNTGSRKKKCVPVRVIKHKSRQLKQLREKKVSTMTDVRMSKKVG
jgi:hypothetical protein